MTQKTPIRIALACIALCATGCATIMNNRMVEVPVATSPAGAKVVVGGRQYITPTVVSVERKKNQTAQITLEGYQPQELNFSRSLDGWFWGNIIWLNGFWIGMTVDLINGRAFEITPETIAVNLVPDASRSAAISATPASSKTDADTKAYDLVLRVNFTNESWFPLSKPEMTAAVKDKLLERLSESGRFHFVEANDTNGKMTGYINVDITLIESIQTVKLTTTLQIPNGATFIASDDDTLSNKDRRAIYDTFSNVGKKVAENLLKKTNGRI
ncbi:MAG: hypothetical protein AABY83_14780 [Pseudomonadota bacterium]